MKLRRTTLTTLFTKNYLSNKFRGFCGIGVQRVYKWPNYIFIQENKCVEAFFCGYIENLWAMRLPVTIFARRKNTSAPFPVIPHFFILADLFYIYGYDFLKWQHYQNDEQTKTLNPPKTIIRSLYSNTPSSFLFEHPSKWKTIQNRRRTLTR